MTKKEILSISVILALLLSIGTFADLNISRALYNPGTWFPTFFAAAGEIPGTIIGAFCCALMLVTREHGSGRTMLLQNIFWGDCDAVSVRFISGYAAA